MIRLWLHSTFHRSPRMTTVMIYDSRGTFIEYRECWLCSCGRLWRSA